jgi:signal transduction histidine kinase
VAIHATAAQALLASDPSKLAEILAVIRENSVQGLAEMRRMVEVLREPGDLALSQGLAEALPRLAAALTHVQVTVEQVGDPRPLPADVDHAAYRIVQESLTNIARHAAADTASVRIDYRPDALAIRVDDNGKATPATAPMPGVGLLGMRERVTALGGRLRAEPRGEGGFTVQAELPVGQAS